MKKLDLKKELKHLYLPSARQATLVEVPKMQFAMFDGVIQPGQAVDQSKDFQDAMQALYGVGYTLKFMSKRRTVEPIDYTVMALEALWWVESGQFDIERREPWRFTAMMMQPDHITTAMYQEALQQLRQKRDDPALERLRFEPFHEGLCVQIMHLGPYAEEPPTIERMHAFAHGNGYELHGKHHEIYIGDPRRAKPENLKTVLRHPVRKTTDQDEGQREAARAIG